MVVVLWHDVGRLCSSFLVGVTASCAIAGCGRGAQRSQFVAVFVVSSFCILCLVYLKIGKHGA